MTATPPGMQELLDEIAAILLEWDKNGTLGEVAWVRGQNEDKIVARPIEVIKRARREHAGRKTIVETR